MAKLIQEVGLPFSTFSHSFYWNQNMKLLFFFLLVVIGTGVQGVSIRTQVWIKKTGGDQAGPSNELITTVSESGNGQNEVFVAPVDVLSNANFGGNGQLLVDKTFSGSQLPTSIKVRVIEDDGPSSKDDGVCNIKISTTFTTTPITLSCTREANDGLGDLNIVNVRIRRV